MVQVDNHSSVILFNISKLASRCGSQELVVTFDASEKWEEVVISNSVTMLYVALVQCEFDVSNSKVHGWPWCNANSMYFQ